MARDIIGGFEQDVLIAIHQLQGKGYTVSIVDHLERSFGKAPSLGAVYTTTDRLEKKGFVTSKLGDPTPERGGRAKRYFTITAPGLQAMSEALEANAKRSAAMRPVGVVA